MDIVYIVNRDATIPEIEKVKLVSAGFESFKVRRHGEVVTLKYSQYAGFLHMRNAQAFLTMILDKSKEVIDG